MLKILAGGKHQGKEPGLRRMGAISTQLLPLRHPWLQGATSDSPACLAFKTAASAASLLRQHPHFLSRSSWPTL